MIGLQRRLDHACSCEAIWRPSPGRCRHGSRSIARSPAFARDDSTASEKTTMLKIENLHATVADKPILNGLTLTVPAGEVHAIMGPNGAGKSTLAYVLGGRPGYEVTEGSVDVRRRRTCSPWSRTSAPRRGCSSASNIRSKSPACRTLQFLRESLNAQRRARGEKPSCRGAEFIKLARGQGGRARHGRRRCSSARSMSAFRAARRSAPRWSRWASSSPRLAILDETDSGLDIDALRSRRRGHQPRSCARPTRRCC